MTHEIGLGGLHEAVGFAGDWASGLGYVLLGLHWMDGHLPFVEALGGALVVVGKSMRQADSMMDIYDHQMIAQEIVPFTAGPVPGVIFFE